jgi:hypothetical protein
MMGLFDDLYGAPEVAPQPAKAKAQINPALVNALTPPTALPIQTTPSTAAANVLPVAPTAQMSPKDRAAFNLAQQNRLASEALKREDEKRKEENPMASLSEGERKAATLLQRLQFSEQQIKDVLKQTPDATKPEYLPTFIEGISETGANLIRSEPRQQIETAQMDLLDAALTLGTGAAYTKEQLKGYRESYFPQIGDSPNTIKDKEARLSNIVVAAKIAAGRAAKLVPEVKGGNNPPVGAPPDAKQAKDGNWYSPDPKRPGKYLMWGN